LIDATYSKPAEPHLRQVNLGLEKLRFLFRLASDLRIIDLRRYEHAARAINDVGRVAESKACLNVTTICSAISPALPRCTRRP
jgi:hypothetical protein